MPKLTRKVAPPKAPKTPIKSFYSDQFTAEELALVTVFIEDVTLDDEIWMQRVFNRRLVAVTQTADDVPLETLVKVAEALARGTGRVARLLRDKRALSGEAADGIAGAIAAALDELATELGEQL
jgi:hypothetical protein